MKLNKKLTVIILGVGLAILNSCSSSLRTDCSPPEWFFKPPTDPNHFFAVKTATSTNMQLAIEKAETAARGGISKQVVAHVKTLEKKFIEEVGGVENAEVNQHFKTVIKIVSKTTLVGSKVIESKVCNENNGYRAYVLVDYPIGVANKALVEQLKKDKLLYERFRSTSAYKELEEETKNLPE